MKDHLTVLLAKIGLRKDYQTVPDVMYLFMCNVSEKVKTNVRYFHAHSKDRRKTFMKKLRE